MRIAIFVISFAASIALTQAAESATSTRVAVSQCASQSQQSSYNDLRSRLTDLQEVAESGVLYSAGEYEQLRIDIVSFVNCNRNYRLATSLLADWTELGNFSSDANY